MDPSDWQIKIGDTSKLLATCRRRCRRRKVWLCKFGVAIITILAKLHYLCRALSKAWYCLTIASDRFAFEFAIQGNHILDDIESSGRKEKKTLSVYTWLLSVYRGKRMKNKTTKHEKDFVNDRLSQPVFSAPP